MYRTQYRSLRYLLLQLAVVNIVAAGSIAPSDKSEPKSRTSNGLGENVHIELPQYLSWMQNQTRFDLIFSLGKPLNLNTTLDHVDISQFSNALKPCIDARACLIKDKSFALPFKLVDDPSHKSRIVYESAPKNIELSPSKNQTANWNCPTDSPSRISVNLYCNTHWNPPQHQAASACDHVIDWRSPYSCGIQARNYEKPCFIYNSDGHLIDLTSLIRSDGTSNSVDVGSHKLKNFQLNICNEAHDACGPNVSSCYADGQNHVEAGFLNSTSLKIGEGGEGIQLTQLGQSQNGCTTSDGRIKTIVNFKCAKNVSDLNGPKLERFSRCENIINWNTIHACPTKEISESAIKCGLELKSLNVKIDFTSLVKNITIELGGLDKTMALSMCRGFSSMRCEGKKSSQTSACIYDSTVKPGQLNQTNSAIISSITQSQFRLSDDRFYWESFHKQKTCESPMGRNFNATLRVGARVEFVCSAEADLKPKFLGYNDCVYLFEWPTRLVCPDTFHEIKDKAKHIILSDNLLPDKELKISLDPIAQNGTKLHSQNIDDSKRIMGLDNQGGKLEVKNSTSPHAEKSGDTSVKPNQSGSKIHPVYKSLMIGLILALLASFIVIIFVLDRKTKFNIPLGNMRRRFRPSSQRPVPYNRLDDDLNDGLDL